MQTRHIHDNNGDFSDNISLHRKLRITFGVPTIWGICALRKNSYVLCVFIPLPYSYSVNKFYKLPPQKEK